MRKLVDVILFMGQSNMAGRGTISEMWPEKAPRILPGAGYEFRAITDPEKLYPIEEPFGLKENTEDGINDGEMKTGSLVTAFVNAYYTHNGEIPVVGISASKGGSVIGEWQPGGRYLTDTLQRLLACVEYLNANDYSIRYKFVLWCQGESDGDVGTSKDNYLQSLDAMWSELQRNGIEQFFMIGIGNCNIEGSYEQYKAVQAWQKEFAGAKENVCLISTTFESMRERGLMKDAFHYFQKGYNECGEDAGINAARFLLNNINN